MKRIQAATVERIGPAVDSFFNQPEIRVCLDTLRACFPEKARFLVAGGAIRNLIIELIHGSAPATQDIDLFIAAVEKDLPLPRELTAANIHPTELGGWRWQPSGCPYAFDLCLLPNFAIIAKYGLAPTPENLLQSVDFTVNAVVYDVAGRRMFEQHCISDISRRVIEFNTRRMTTKLLHAYRILLVGHKTGFRLSEEVFSFVRRQLDIDTLSALQHLLSSKQGEQTTRLILKKYDRICRCADYGEYLKLN